jgi:hypothetical protein
VIDYGTNVDGSWSSDGASGIEATVLLHGQQGTFNNDPQKKGGEN